MKLYTVLYYENLFCLKNGRDHPAIEVKPADCRQNFDQRIDQRVSKYRHDSIEKKSKHTIHHYLWKSLENKAEEKKQSWAMIGHASVILKLIRIK